MTIFTGTSGNDIITGTAGDDFIYTGGGNDVVQAGDGNDTVILSGPLGFGSNLNGGNGNDTLVVTSASANFDFPGTPPVPLVLFLATPLSGFETLAYGSQLGETVIAVIRPDQAAGITTLKGGAGADILSINVDAAGTYLLSAFNLDGWNDATDIIAMNVQPGLGAALGNVVLNAADHLGVTVRMAGGDGNDTLNGAAGTDILNGGAGADTLNGGAGSNTAVFTGNYADYTITIDSGTGVITTSGPDGNDTLINISHLQFADLTANIVDGVVVDGYLAGATVFADVNGNSVLDVGETSTTTAGDGSFTLLNPQGAVIRAVGGTNVDTGLANTLTLSAPDGSTVINPLTTLVEVLVEGGATKAAAETQVKAALGIDPSVDLTTFDPLAPLADPAAALAVQKAAASVVVVLEVIVQASGGGVAAEAAGLQSIVEALNTATTANPLDLTNTATLSTILTTALPIGTDPAAITTLVTTTAASTQAIDDATDLGGITNVQANHDPLLTGSAAVLAAGSEDMAYTVTAASLLAGFTDTDNDTLSVSGVSADHGVVVANLDGSFTITPQTNYNGLMTLSYFVGDGQGGSTAASLGFALLAVNDAAIIGGVTSGTLAESSAANGTSQVSGVLTISDVDSPTSFIAGALSGLYGTLTLAAAGDWTYALNNGNADVDGLSTGQSLTDTIAVSSADGTLQNIILTISGTDDIRTGTSGNNVLTGTSGNDSLFGLGGNDTLNAGNGNDMLDGGAGNDSLNGGAGIDTANYASATKSVTVSLANQGSAQDTDGAGKDTLSGIENLTGSSFNDKLTGSSGDNIINGGAGNDEINGGAGNDTLDGGIGNDKLIGGSGIDTASYQGAASGVTVNLSNSGTQNTGGAGNDSLSEIENLIGSALNDTLIGSSGANSLNGGIGNDRLTGGGGADDLWGGAGSDLFILTRLGDSLAAAKDTIRDFNRSEGDKIDLHLIDAIAGGRDSAFSLVNAFTHTAGQLVSIQAGDHYSVMGDVNGDGIADFMFDVHSAVALISSDYIL
jgi:VCBS repeat-containing protein